MQHSDEKYREQMRVSVQTLSKHWLINKKQKCAKRESEKGKSVKRMINNDAIGITKIYAISRREIPKSKKKKKKKITHFSHTFHLGNACLLGLGPESFGLHHTRTRKSDPHRFAALLPSMRVGMFSTTQPPHHLFLPIVFLPSHLLVSRS